MRRDICWSCFRDGAGEHHILPRSLFPDLVDDPENVIPLCGECHDRVHGYRIQVRVVLCLTWRCRATGQDVPDHLALRVFELFTDSSGQMIPLAERMRNLLLSNQQPNSPASKGVPQP